MLTKEAKARQIEGARKAGKASAKPVEFEIDENGCFVVTSHKPFAGKYNYLMRDCRTQRLHRYVWEQITKKPIPDGFVVHHTCGNVNCINPNHLRLMLKEDHDSYHANRQGLEGMGLKLYDRMWDESDKVIKLDLVNVG
jgi:hypothetical protein